MYPLTHDTPKALLPLGGGGVILDAIVAGLGSEIAKCLLVTNHKFVDQFRAWRSRRGMTLEILDDGTERPEERLGAIRDLELARVEGRAEGDLLVVGTDNLFKWPLADFVERARAHAPHPGVALWEAPSKAVATQFGVVTVDRTDRIAAFVEKSPQPPSALVAMCVYYFPKPMCSSIRQFLDEQRDTDAPDQATRDQRADVVADHPAAVARCVLQPAPRHPPTPARPAPAHRRPGAPRPARRGPRGRGDRGAWDRGPWRPGMEGPTEAAGSRSWPEMPPGARVFPQRCQRLVEPRLHGAERDAHRVRDLLQREPVHEPQ